MSQLGCYLVRFRPDALIAFVSIFKPGNSRIIPADGRCQQTRAQLLGLPVCGHSWRTSEVAPATLRCVDERTRSASANTKFESRHTISGAWINATTVRSGNAATPCRPMPPSRTRLVCETCDIRTLAGWASGTMKMRGASFTACRSIVCSHGARLGHVSSGRINPHPRRRFRARQRV